MGRWTGHTTRVLLALALAAAVTGCTAGRDAAEPTDGAGRQSHGKGGSNGFVVQYRTGGRAATATGYLRAHRILDAAADRLNATLKVPQRIPFVVRSCGAAEPAYDPETGTIDFCAEHVDEIRERFRQSAPGPDRSGGTAAADAHVAAVLEETAYHEGAHALIDRLGLRFTGREEDVADQFAAVLLIGQGRAGERKARAAADDYALAAEETPLDAADLRDEHSLDGQRAANYACYVYGAHPDRHEDLVGSDARLDAERAEGCPDEWAQARDGWRQLLTAHLKRPL
ncbi:MULTISPECIES: DUF4344 domain-containing metallopeptidase [Streptomyces]|uniref:DUF4344 domain-containing metallopeptidase n=1 Tax=Streptomyces TaxID=1883 RepID=UPI001F3D7A90|nr:DUF4344 domain-containing metallopeptidase [Streptomyces noursei]MCE4942014.1 DUF4344 domain-containing metallopeptidase [Streptomyces noursei]